MKSFVDHLKELAADTDCKQCWFEDDGYGVATGYGVAYYDSNGELENDPDYLACSLEDLDYYAKEQLFYKEA